MNLKTTVVLVVLVVAGGSLYWFGPAAADRLGLAQKTPDATGAGTLAILENELTPDKLTRVEIQQGPRRVVLERGPGGDWVLPGNWPTRTPEVTQLIGSLTELRSRFAPLPLTDDPADLQRYGLDQPAVTVRVRAGNEYRLLFAEKAEAGEESNRFSWPTYLRLGDNPEVVRLRPGLVALLDRPADYYQQRRLFPNERVPKEGDPQEKVERLAAKGVSTKEKNGGYTLNRTGDEWQLREPVHDRADPDKLKTLLAAVPDIWAERFVDNPKKDLAEYGLASPEQTLSVTRPDGGTVTLLVGKESPTKEERLVPAPTPPPFGPPQPPMPPTRITETFRYAKLKDNDQLFEIKAGKLKDVFVAADTLRDPQLARFRTEDVRRLEVTQAGQDIVVVKDKDHWRLQKPMEADAESSKITELLDKIAGLQARDKDVHDKADPKTHGLDKPAGTIKVTAEEEVKGTGDSKTKKTKTFTLLLGQPDNDKKLYVQVEGWDRINTIEDNSLLSLVKRPALAYRGRRVFDFASSDLDKIEVQRGGEKMELKQVKDKWQLTAPAVAEADAVKAGKLAGDLGRLEAVEYVSEAPKPEELDKTYGLAKPELTAKVSFTDAAKKPQTLLLGKQREGKPEYFAKLDLAPGVFVVSKDLHDALDQKALAFRPLQLWSLPPGNIAGLRILKEGQEEYRLAGSGLDWKISGPFEANAMAGLVQPMLNELTGPYSERYEANTAKDLAAYGLDKPYLRLTLTPAVKKDAAGKEPVKERVLLIGKPSENGDGTPKNKGPVPVFGPAGDHAMDRFAKLGDSDAVVIVGAKLVSAVDHGALDLLDRNLLKLDAKAIERIRITSDAGTLALQRQGEEWRVMEAPAPAFAADEEVMAGVLGVWSNLRAQRFAAYGPKAEPAKFGLDKPSRTIAVTTQPAAKEGGKPKTVEHTLTLGKAVEGAAGERYARLDNGPGVVILDATAVQELSRTHLDFVNRDILKFDAAKVTALRRQRGADLLEVVKRDDGWHLIKPADQRADDPTLQALLEQLSGLRALRVAAYPAQDLKPFGLDAPAAVLTVRLAGAEGKATEHTLKIGKADEKTGDRFALVDNSQAVAVLPKALMQRLLAAPLAFRDRTLAHVTNTDRVLLERGPRRATFTKADGTWKLTEPLAAEAEQTELDDFVNAVAQLRADELVAEKPADLKPYGLDKPAARWCFQMGDKDVLSLLIGNRDQTGTRVYAKLAAGDLVVLLDPALTTKVLGEYRNRAVWAMPPDAAQVDAIRYSYARDAFALEKKDTTWQVTGKPDLPVKAEAVSDMLAALAGLRVERFVVDKDADLKLYGLEPPELVLEVQTRTDKRTLHIGRREGDSKRYYARVPDKDRTDVFVLSEADAGRIVRALSAFTGKK